MSAVRYPARVVVRARQHREAGWAYAQIGRLLDQEFGVRPAGQSIREWCMEPAELKEHRAARSQGRYWGREKLAGRFSVAWKARTVRELSEAGVTQRQIGLVAGVWWGEPLSENQVRYLLEKTP